MGEVKGGNGGGRVKGGRSEGWKWRWEGEGWRGSFLVCSKVMLSTCTAVLACPLAVATCDPRSSHFSARLVTISTTTEPVWTYVHPDSFMTSWSRGLC